MVVIAPSAAAHTVTNHAHCPGRPTHRLIWTAPQHCCRPVGGGGCLSPTHLRMRSGLVSHTAAVNCPSLIWAATMLPSSTPSACQMASCSGTQQPQQHHASACRKQHSPQLTATHCRRHQALSTHCSVWLAKCSGPAVFMAATSIYTAALADCPQCRPQTHPHTHPHPPAPRVSGPRHRRPSYA